MAKYVGKRVVPKHCGAWTKNKEYEMLSIVLDEASGESYISRRQVPSGTLLTDEYYWSICSLFSQQIADMGEEFEERHQAISQNNAETLRQIRADNDATETAIRQDNDATEQAINQDNSNTRTHVDEVTGNALTQMNQAKQSFNQSEAQLNARMDAVLRAGTGDAQTEVRDARVDADGVEHDSLGEAIREGYTFLKTELDNLRSDISYDAVAVTAFSVTPSLAEMGSTVAEVVLAYALNVNPASVQIDGQAVEALKSASITRSGLALKASKTWTLLAKDGGSATKPAGSATRTAALTFYNRVYYGAAEDPGTISSSFLLGLANGVLTGARARSFTADAGAGKYIWYAVPVRFGACAFNVGGFDGGFTLAGTISHTNASGYTENYYVYRSDNAGLGSTAVTVS